MMHGMDTTTLRAALDAKGIDPDAYDLTGEGKNEAYVLREGPAGWVVFYNERGFERDIESFGSEDEACHALIAKVTSDPTARR